ncbi:glycosyltransferase family 2 protein [Francisella sp. Scap27]|uniref:glycosyltransferase family 2 protein n=1 Tax=Francisella sp. Scap27 TaxID=2589986 RepID=UPI0015BA09FD|nr:glycosyltransferase family 2 protein [Francisella sp. Scap27]QLE78812.1 glycosyltransferase family 2 protein [Francisella sp. Scap27]
MNIDDILVSVIIPSYNHEKYILDCVNSVVNQTHKKIELIIVDDGSKDSTLQSINSLIPEITYRFENIVFIDKKINEGVVKTLNIGLEYVTGEFINIIASDDILKPNNIEVLVSFLAENDDYVLAVGDNEIVDNRGVVGYWTSDEKIIYDRLKASYKTFGSYLRQLRKDVDFSSNDFGKYESFLSGNYIPNGYMIRKNILVDLMGGYPTNCQLEDLGLHLYLSRYGKYKFIDRPLAAYRWHNTNTSHQSEKMLKATVETLNTQLIYAKKELGFHALLKLFIKNELYCDVLIELFKLFPEDAVYEIKKLSHEINSLNVQLEKYNSMILVYESDLESYKTEINEIYDSLGWKLMRPFRMMMKAIKLFASKIILR